MFCNKMKICRGNHVSKKMVGKINRENLRGKLFWEAAFQMCSLNSCFQFIIEI